MDQGFKGIIKTSRFIQNNKYLVAIRRNMKNTINMLIVISIFMVSCDDSSSTASTAVICGANEYVSSNACVACAAGTVN